MTHYTTSDLIGEAIKVQVREHETKRKPRVLALEYFVAGVPPYALFEQNVEGLEKILAAQKQQSVGIDQLAELCFIGLAAYFEAFCKDLFAAVVNVCPDLLDGFGQLRPCTFALAEVRHLAGGSKHRIGSLLSEHYDWGSAQAVNGLFLDLVKVSPFSKVEGRRYAEFLNDRNLLVHHGGVYTFKYSGQKFSRRKLKTLVYWNSLTVQRRDVSKWGEFLLGIARKTSAATHKAVEGFVHSNGVRLGTERERATRMLIPD